ncbi:MAG TPA: dTDP-4-dehydrorhamnose 3,5-epimerase family protein [Bryobacteraceae bacterium]
MAPTTARENNAPNPVAWSLPANHSKGIGKVILKADSTDLIEGVRVNPFPIWPDDRGYFAEIVRIGEGLPRDFPAASTQVSMALSYPGSIKAFHYHQFQTDFWVPVNGMFQVALVDLRADSLTFGLRNTFYVGTLRPWQILIPPGVGHGYKVIGTDPAMLVYVTNRIYNPKDEGRIPHDDPGIHYDWELQHK